MAELPGTACWVSLTTPDRRATEAFYGAVLGWSFDDGALAPEARVATLAGEPVAGLNEAAAARGLPARWTVFFLVEDADGAAELIAERGGTVAVGPVDFGSGRTVLGADPCGAAFGLWQGTAPPRWGVGAGRAPVRLCLRTCDPQGALAFYGAVLGRGPDGAPSPGGTGPRLRTGARPGDPEPAARPRWEVAFPVADPEVAAAAARRNGGSPVALPEGGVTVCDPHGALFGLARAEP